MASFKTTLKRALLNYPTIFPNPVDVCVHLFCVIGNGYEWKAGELVDPFSRRAKPTVDTYDPMAGVSDEIKAMLDHNLGFNLKKAACKLQHSFVVDNIDAIVSASPTNVYFGRDPRGYYFVKGISLDYAKAFHFPDDIKPDWAKALYTFFEYWLVQLNIEYGVGNELDDVSWWPEDVQKARKAILDTRIRLHPYAHNGETYEERVTKANETWNRIKVDVLAP